MVEEQFERFWSDVAQGMALEEVHLTPKNITEGLDILRKMESLITIGISFADAWPAAEFWPRYDKGLR